MDPLREEKGEEGRKIEEDQGSIQEEMEKEEEVEDIDIGKLDLYGIEQACDKKGKGFVLVE